MMGPDALFAVLSTRGGRAGTAGAAGLTVLGVRSTVGMLAETITYKAVRIRLHGSFRRLAIRPHAELWVRISENNPSATFRNVGIRNMSEATSYSVRYPRSDERSTRGAR
jgi:hypothetical protein